jgi:hypothetical protein
MRPEPFLCQFPKSGVLLFVGEGVEGLFADFLFGKPNKSCMV